MNREFLEGLELDKETVDKVMAEHGKAVTSANQELESVTTERDNLKEQVIARDEQLEELKEVDAEALQAKIDELQEENTAQETEYEEKLHQQAFDFKLKEALVDANVRNPKAVEALLDMESIKLDGDKLLNLDDQLEQLKESDDYLFNQEVTEDETKPPTIVNGGNPDGGENNDGDPFAAKLAKYN